MKRATLAAFLLFAFFAIQAQIDIASPGYISMKDTKVELNFPQLGVSVKLPSNMGIKFPRLGGENVAVELDEQTYFMFDLNYLHDYSSRAFSFAMSTDEDTPLWLDIMPADDTTKKIFASSSSDVLVKNAEKEYLDQLHRENLKTTTNEFAIRTFYYDGHFFNFYFFHKIDLKQRKLYESVIKNFSTKNLTTKKEQDEQRVALGYYDPKKNDKIEPINNGIFQSFDGELSKATTFDYPYLGISLQIPEGFRYSVKGTSITETKPNTKEVALGGIDLYNEKMIFSTYRCDDFSITTRVSEKGYLNPIESIKTQTDNYKYTKWAKSYINGIPAEVVFTGLEAMGNIEVGFSFDDKDVWISISGYSNKTKDKIDRIFSTLKLVDKSAENKQTEMHPLFSSLFRLKDMPDITLDEITLPKPNTSNDDKWLLADFGLHFNLEGRLIDYLKSEKNDYVPIKSTQFAKSKPQDEQENFSLTNTSYTTTLTISLSRAPKSKEFAQEQAMKEAKYTWDSYKFISNLKAGIADINGIKWSVLIYEQMGMYLGMAYTFKDGYQITLYKTSSSTIEEVYKTLGYLHTFSFK